jgi:hypothetical protein
VATYRADDARIDEEAERERDRERVELPETGEEGLGAGDGEQHAAEDGKVARADEKEDESRGVKGAPDTGVGGEVIDAAYADDEKPDGDTGRKDEGDPSGAGALNEVEGDKDANGDPDDGVGVQAGNADGKTGCGRDNGDGGGQGSVREGEGDGKESLCVFVSCSKYVR